MKFWRHKEHLFCLVYYIHRAHDKGRPQGEYKKRSDLDSTHDDDKHIRHNTSELIGLVVEWWGNEGGMVR